MEPFIVKDEGGAYSLVVPNSDGLEIGFKSSIDDPASGVRLLGQMMPQGVEEVIANSQYIFDDAGQLTVEELTGFFEITDSIVVDSVIVYACAQGATILDDLAAAGLALAAV